MLLMVGFQANSSKGILDVSSSHIPTSTWRSSRELRRLAQTPEDPLQFLLSTAADDLQESIRSGVNLRFAIWLRFVGFTCSPKVFLGDTATTSTFNVKVLVMSLMLFLERKRKATRLIRSILFLSCATGFETTHHVRDCSCT